MPQTSERTASFTESVIRRMTRVANQYNAINLSQGFPDFDPPEEVLAALERATRGNFHQYAVTWGAPPHVFPMGHRCPRPPRIAATPTPKG